MGLIRFILAAAVLALHCNTIFGLTFVGGDVAVQAFYMISGFYMALVLDGKYKTNNWQGYKLFITNRLLKLYPIYWLTLIGVLALGVVSYFALNSDYIFSYYIDNPSALTPANWAYFVFTNLFIIGQDLLFIVGYNESGYFFEKAYQSAPMPLHRFLFIKQAWTISLEIYFYLLVPFIDRIKKNTLIVITIILFATRFYFYYLGYTDLPWLYQFFPFELGFFIIGLLAYRWYKANKEKITTSTLPKYIFLAVIVLTFAYQFVGADSLVKKYIYLTLFASSIPFVFAHTKNTKWDRFIGETSYPIYMTHSLLSLVISFVLPKDSLVHGFVVLIVSLIVSITFNSTILRFIENYRQRRVVK